MTNNRVLLAYDGTPESNRAVEAAATYLTAAEVYILTVWEPQHRTVAKAAGMTGMLPAPTTVTDEESDPARQDAEAICQRGVERATALGVSATAYVVECASAVWSAIVDAADDLDADIIVTGTKGTTGIRSLLTASVADHVLRYSSRPVFIVPPGEDQEQRIATEQ